MSLARIAVPLPGGSDPEWPTPQETPRPEDDKDYHGKRTEKYCHLATTVWLYEATYGQAPTRDVVLDRNLPQRAMNACLQYGRQIQQSISTNAAGIKFCDGGGAVPAGSILIFAKVKTQADHSCVLKDTNWIVGYNQVNWFKTLGRFSSYSDHSPKDIQWLSDKRHVQRMSDKLALYAVPEQQAKAALRSITTPPLMRRK